MKKLSLSLFRLGIILFLATSCTTCPITSSNSTSSSSTTTSTSTSVEVPEESYFKDVVFTDTSLEYTGEFQEVRAANLPDDTIAIYSNNRHKDVGVYRAFCYLEAPTEELTLSIEFEITKISITNIEFEDVQYSYDGTLKYLEISTPAPLDTEVKYYHNNIEFTGVKEVGSYEIEVRITGSNHIPYSDFATLTIVKGSITGMSFSSKSFKFDNGLKFIEVMGNAPSGSTIEYTLDDQEFIGVKFPGDYEIVAAITNPNYETLELRATITITKGTISGITYTNKSVQYDGNNHMNYVTGDIPKHVTVTYTVFNGTFNGSNQTGSYYVTATLSSPYYNEVVLYAYLYIVANALPSPLNLRVEVVTNKNYLTWDNVSGAFSYEVIASNTDDSYIGTSARLNENRIDVDQFLRSFKVKAGDYKLSVVAYPSATGAQSTAPSVPSTPYTHHLALGKLETPTNVRIEGMYLKYDLMPNARFHDIMVVECNSLGEPIANPRTGRVANTTSVSLYEFAGLVWYHLPSYYRFAVSCIPQAVMPNGQVAIFVELASDFSEYTEVIHVPEQA